MKKPNKALLFSLSAIALLIIVLAITYRFIPMQTPQEYCQEKNLTWVENYSECESMEQEICDYLGGEYTECGSACRHEPEAEYCILMCIPYCTFDQ
ncbi:hypothetical protein CMI41_02195 [Candidatus Pacearchaeota archaeon]|nr:hypothetical protein [Candidatus Pacearchaeota archaeon]|tara:strand:+ start:5123 stop:5410 length:288 start_codon:yes stop_codon:yes gene_type:complete